VTAGEPTTPDYVSVSPGIDLFPDTTEGANIPLFYPLFKLTSDITGWPIQVFWLAGALTLSMVVGALAMIYLQSMLIAGIVSGTAVVMFCTMEIIPWWVLYVYIFAALTFIIYQRVTST